MDNKYDIAPELLERLRADLKNELSRYERYNNFRVKLEKGGGTYAEALKIAESVGRILSKVLITNMEGNTLPEGRLYYEIARQVIRPILLDNFDIVAGISQSVQQNLNKKAGIGLKAVKAEVPTDRIWNFIDVVSKDNPEFEEVKYLFKGPVINYSQSIVDSTIKANADFQSDAGLNVKFKRTNTTACCEWCKQRAGLYDYNKIKGNPEYFKRHQNCNCTLDLITARGQSLNHRGAVKRKHKTRA